MGNYLRYRPSAARNSSRASLKFRSDHSPCILPDISRANSRSPRPSQGGQSLHPGVVNGHLVKAGRSQLEFPGADTSTSLGATSY